jgi:hypothetical protein
MSGDLSIQTNGPYLRVVLPDFDPDWVGVWEALDFELEDGIKRAEIVAPRVGRIRGEEIAVQLAAALVGVVALVAGFGWLARRSGLSNAQLARRSLVSSQSMNEVLLALGQGARE